MKPKPTFREPLAPYPRRPVRWLGCTAPLFLRPAPAGEFNFFNTTLSLRSQLSYHTVFADAGLQPGDSVSVKELASAAQSAVGAKVAFGCQNDGLQTVSTCLSKDLQPIDCPSYVYSGNYGNCDPSSTIEWRSAADTRANADAAVAIA